MTPPTNVGIVGTGNIFAAYARGLARLTGIDAVACADVDRTRSAQAASRYGIKDVSVEELLADPSIDIVVNLTPPLFHADVSQAAIGAGKHVYTEKPLAATFEEAHDLVAAAESRGVTVASAPDTFLGAAGQTARKAVDDGLIGDIVGATAFVTHSHAEVWHPDPSFLFQPGGGPSLDMGPYYLAALINLLGPVEEVYASARRGADRRPVTSPDRLVEEVRVEIPTHSAAVLQFASGVVGDVMMSFEVWHHELPHLELYGTKGTLSVPDPDRYDDQVRFHLHGDEGWRTLEPIIIGPTTGLSADELPLRGPGVADLARSVHRGEPPRCSAELALHALEVLETIAVGDRNVHQMTTSCQRPEPVERPDREKE